MHSFSPSTSAKNLVTATILALVLLALLAAADPKEKSVERTDDLEKQFYDEPQKKPQPGFPATAGLAALASACLLFAKHRKKKPLIVGTK